MGESDRARPPLLSESRFLAGLQCHKRLYLECFHPDCADPVDSAQQALSDAGTLVGDLVQGVHACGALGDGNHFRRGVIASIGAELSDSSVPVIVEARFQYQDVRIRTDILACASDGRFDLLLVKSSTGVNEEQLTDAALQLYVVAGCGMMVGRICLVSLNKDYVSPGGDCDVAEPLRLEDVTEEVLKIQPDIPPALEAMRSALQGPEPPDIRVGNHCSKPCTCPFYAYCHIRG